MALLSDPALCRGLTRLSPAFETISADWLGAEARTLWADSDEEDMAPMDGSGLDAGGARDASENKRAATALGRFSTDMTAQAEAVGMDRIVGRDEQIRQIVDVLLRRRQNNPILTGEAGVGKTAVVEGFAQALARGDVPPKLRGIRLHALDIGAMQAGAGMKGEFEQRLKSVIDEVQNAPVPIILFIEGAHTLIGAGGPAGTGDAANLMKPALARGTLRTIAATIWAEYRTHFEKDPALARRFQSVMVDEPDVARWATMLRGALEAMEAHHGVRISDEAIVAAVNLPARYIPSRQLPDKAVSLLDTACARVAVSQSTTPARIADLRADIAALGAEIASKEAQRDLGEKNETRVETARAEEKTAVDRILSLRMATGDDAAGDGTNGASAAPPPAPDAETRVRIAEDMATLAAGNPDDRMVYAHMDELEAILLAFGPPARARHRSGPRPARHRHAHRGEPRTSPTPKSPSASSC